MLILITGKAFYRREKLSNKPKTHSISQVKLMSCVPQFVLLCSIWARTKSALFCAMALILAPSNAQDL